VPPRRPVGQIVKDCWPRCRSSTRHGRGPHLGCGQPAGEAGYNIARVAAILAGLDDVPGVTVNRYCSSSLQTIRMAAHAIKAGEGDVLHRRRRRDRQPLRTAPPTPAPTTRVFADAEARTAERAAGRRRQLDPPEGLPDIYIAMGQTAENVARPRASPARRWTSSPPSPSSAPWPRRERLLRARDHPGHPPDGTVVSTDDGPRAGTTAEKLAELKPVFRPDGGHRRQRLPAQRRRRRRHRHERHQGQGELGLTPLARIVSSGVSASTPRSWASARSRPAARPSAGPA
jgi:acetyl-CoA C-acetyltransferase